MKKLAAFIFGLLISLSFYADARLVSGTAQHQHDSATGGGATINNTSIGSNSKIAPSIFVYDKDAPLNEKYWKFGNASGDFVLFTHNDAQEVSQLAFSITRTGTTTNLFTISPALTASAGISTTTGSFSSTVSSTKACETGYTRVGPNFCHRNTPTWVSLLRDSCTTIGGASSGSQAILLRTLAHAGSVNAEGARRAFVDSYTTNACTTTLIPLLSEARANETPGIPAGSTLGSDSSTVILRSPDGIGGQHYIKFEDDAGNGGAVYYMFLGYYD